MGTRVDLVNFDINIVVKSMNEIKENPKNARIHSQKQIHKIMKSFENYGFNSPILIDSDSMIIAGHGRLEAAKKLGMQSIPTICLKHLTPEKVKAYAIADNKLGLESEWDMGLLKLGFEEVLDLGFNIEDTGFDIPEFDMIVIDPPKEKVKKQYTLLNKTFLKSLLVLF